MSLLIIALAVLALVVLSSWGKVNPFLAFLLVTIPAGLALGLPPAQVLAAVQKGLGDTLGSVALVVVLGAMLGKLVAESGAAQRKLPPCSWAPSGPEKHSVDHDVHGSHHRHSAVLQRGLFC